MRTKSAITILALAVTGQLAGAQAGGAMSRPMAKEVAYTGCLEAGTAAGSFKLTHVTDGTAMHEDAMGKNATHQDAMAHKDAMGKGPMGKDAMGKDAMGKGDSMEKAGANKEAMAPTTLALVGKGIDLSKHVGHKVSVTGRGDAAAFTASSVKMIAGTCGM